MKTFQIPIKITLSGYIAVEAETNTEAAVKAENAMYWGYHAGDPTDNDDVSITECEIDVDNESVDLLKYRTDVE